MRWTELFSELEGDAAELARQERDLDIADRTRSQLGSVRWLDRCAQSDVVLDVRGLGIVRGHAETVAGPWILVHVDDRTDWIVAVDAVMAVHDAPRGADSVSRRGQVAGRMTWVNAWTVLSRDRDRVHVVRVDGSSVTGVPNRVGRDFVELGTDAGRAELVPYAAIAAVRCPR